MDREIIFWIILVGIISYILGRFQMGGNDILYLIKVILFLTVSYFIGDILRKGDNKYIRKRKNNELVSKVYFTMLGALILIVLYYFVGYIIPKRNED